jgi:Tfp pilus assembly protein PilF
MPSKWPLAAGLALLTVAAYAPLWRNDFIDLDDELYITGNPAVRQGFTAEGFRWAWSTEGFATANWHPLTWLSLQLDAHLFGLSPAAFHGQNLFWHLASVLLLFHVLRQITGATGCSFVVAALFAVHPLHVESVAWAAERKDVLSVFFGVVTLWVYGRYAAAPSAGRYLAVAAAFALSLLAKPMLVTLPCVLLLLDYWPLRRLKKGTRLVLLEKVPLLALSAGASLMAVLSQSHASAVISLDVLPLPDRLANAATAYLWYLEKTFWPAGLTLFYPHPMTHWAWPPVLVACGVLAAVSAAALALMFRRPWLFVGWLWFVGTLVPVIGLTQVGAQAYADRFAYWPHIGLFIAVVWEAATLLDAFRVPARLQAGLTAAVVAILAVVTWFQVETWRDVPTVWQHALAVTADNHRADANLGQYQLKQGELAEARDHLTKAARLQPAVAEYRYGAGTVLLILGDLDEAARQLHEAVNGDPSNPYAWNSLGVVRLRQHKLEAAARDFRKALELQPDSAVARSNLGRVYWQQNERAAAEREFEEALRHNPQEAEALNGLGLVALSRQHNDRAADYFIKAIQANPVLAKAYANLGVAQERRQAWEDARTAYEKAVKYETARVDLLRGAGGTAEVPGTPPELVTYRCRFARALRQTDLKIMARKQYDRALAEDPEWPKRFAARAWGLATACDAAARDPATAVELAEMSCQVEDATPADRLDVLAAAYAAAGRFAEARFTASQALTRATAAGQTDLARAVAGRLRLYEQDKAACGP